MSVHAKLRGLYAITDTHLIPRERFVETVEAAVRGGATMIQLREKETPREDIIRLGKAVLEVTRRYGALLIINDHPSVAKEIGADGAHVGREDPPVRGARPAGSEPLLGRPAMAMWHAPWLPQEVPITSRLAPRSRRQPKVRNVRTFP